MKYVWYVWFQYSTRNRLPGASRYLVSKRFVLELSICYYLPYLYIFLLAQGKNTPCDKLIDVLPLQEHLFKLHFKLLNHRWSIISPTLVFWCTINSRKDSIIHRDSLQTAHGNKPSNYIPSSYTSQNTIWVSFTGKICYKSFDQLSYLESDIGK